MSNPVTDFDGAWKEALEQYLEPFLALCFPQAHADIDWTHAPVFLESELQQVAPDERRGKQRVDKLIRVVLLSGEDAWVLIHVEIQSQRDVDFAERMFRYHARLYDRYQRQVVSLAVLGDEEATWRPNRFGYDLWGCALDLTFPIIKLIDLDRAALEQDHNLFATIILSHLDSIETRSDQQERARRKIARYRQLLEQGHTIAHVRALLNFMDRLLRLPRPLAQAVTEAMEQIDKELHMSYITSFEEIGIEKGRIAGLQDGIALALRIKFGEASGAVVDEVRQIADLATLEAIMAHIEAAPSLDTVRQLYAGS